MGDAAHAMVPFYGQGMNCVRHPFQFESSSQDCCYSRLFIVENALLRRVSVCVYV